MIEVQEYLSSLSDEEVLELHEALKTADSQSGTNSIKNFLQTINNGIMDQKIKPLGARRFLYLNEIYDLLYFDMTRRFIESKDPGQLNFGVDHYVLMSATDGFRFVKSGSDITGSSFECTDNLAAAKKFNPQSQVDLRQMKEFCDSHNYVILAIRVMFGRKRVVYGRGDNLV